VLRDGRRRLADELGELGDRQLPAHQRPQHLHAGGVGQHPEHLDDQAHLIVVDTAMIRTICIHT
jgi:hypothetical protein